MAFITSAPYSSAAVISARDSKLDRLISLNPNRVRSTNVIKSLSVLNEAPLGENEMKTSVFYETFYANGEPETISFTLILIGFFLDEKNLPHVMSKRDSLFFPG